MNILLIVSSYVYGGIKTSFDNLVYMLSEKQNKITILDMTGDVEFPNNENVSVVKLHGKAKYWCTNINGLKSNFNLLYIFFGVLKKVLNRFNLWDKFIFSNIKKLKGFDLAVAYQQAPQPLYVLLHKVEANKKAMYWHSDIDYAGSTAGWDSNLKYVDYIVCVSNAIKEKMIKHFPYMANGQAVVVNNVFDSDKIKKMAEESIPEELNNEKIFKIVSVSRLDKLDKQSKGLDRIPEIGLKLKDMELDFHWTVVGDGDYKEYLESKIQDYGLTNNFSFVGKKTNPYPYMKRADVFCLPSESESFGMVAMESIIVGTPVVLCDFPASSEVVTDKQTGVIVSNTAQGLADGLAKCIKEQGKYSELKNLTLNYKYSSDTVYRQFARLTEEKNNE